MGKAIKCPKCKSTDFDVLGSSKKELSAGKGAAGAGLGVALLGPVGLLGGGAALLGKKGKTTPVCHNCGNTWKVKL